MPNPNDLGTRVDLSAAPGADTTWEDLFPSEDAPTPPQTTAAPEHPPQEPPQAPPPAPEFFIRASKSVYKTPEDAVKGLDEKDSLIDSLRQYAIEKTGYDPVTRQPARQEPQAPQSQFQYLGNGKKLFDDLSDAVTRRDPERYEQVLRTYNNEQLAVNFAPVAPLLSEVARQKAIRTSGKDIPSFLDSPEYKQTLEAMPTLQNAIQSAEADFSFSDRLPELYQLAYLAAQGRRVQAAPPQPVPQTPPPAARPTTAPSTMTPPAPGVNPDMRTSEGRKALIRDAESRGVLDFKF